MNSWLGKSKLFVKRNGSTILTCIGGAGVVATSVMAVKATPKALMLLEQAKEEKGEDLTKFEVARVVGPAYIPSIVTGAATIACIFGANVLGKRQQAGLMSAYALLDSSYKEYKAKVTELYGDDAANKVREELAKDKFEEDGIEIEEDDGKQLFYDEYSKRYFRATNEALMTAEYAINKQLTEDCYATLNDFYAMLGIDSVDYGEHVGWSASQMFETYWTSWIDFYHHKVEMEDGMECWIVDFTEPMAGYEDY